MKKVLLLILIFTSQNILSQKEIHKISKTQKDKNAVIISKDEDKIYKLIELDLKPEFPGGRVKFNKFVDKNYKKSNKRPTLQGKIFATFVIEKDGSLTEIKVLRDIGSGTAAELIRVLKLSPKWKPGKRNGKEVRTLNSIVIPVQV